MKPDLLPLATRLVRAWTRVYTLGLPPAAQIARRDEIASDLWELEHDPDRPAGRWTSMQVVARLLVGIPDDLLWRLDLAADAPPVAARALATAGLMTGPRRISAFGLAATIHLVAMSAVMAMASYSPVATPNRGK